MFKNLRVRKKLILSFIIVALIACISGVTSVAICKNIDTKYSNALIEHGFIQGDIGKLMSAFCRVDGNVHDAIGYYAADDVTAAQKNIQTQGDKIPGYFDTVKAGLKDQESLALLQTARDAWDKYLSKANELVQAGDTTDPQAVQRVQERLVGELDPHYITLYNALATLMDNAITRGTEQSKDLTTFSNLSILVVIAIIAASLLVSLIFGIFISSGLAKPITACTQRIKLLATGDLQTPVPDIHTRDEVGELADATAIIVVGLADIIHDIEYLLGAMSEGNFDVHSQATEKYIGDFEPLLLSLRTINSNLSNTLAQIGQSANQVSTGADQISAGAQSLAQGATEQASAVEELAATVSEISTQIRHSAENAEEAMRKVNDMGATVQTGNRQMGEMLTAMSDINESSGEIKKIIKTIEDIAFQTNILALNAAVEAARAGVAGKGFAVVADEVRNLASKSAEASKNTSALIENSLRAVEGGTQIATATAESMRETLADAGEVTELIQKISAASQEQSRSADQVNDGINQISGVVQTNSATAEESAAASEEFSSQAQLMSELVGRFKLKREPSGGVEPTRGPVPAHAAPTRPSSPRDKY